MSEKILWPDGTDKRIAPFNDRNYKRTDTFYHLTYGSKETVSVYEVWVQIDSTDEWGCKHSEPVGTKDVVTGEWIDTKRKEDWIDRYEAWLALGKPHYYRGGFIWT